jgi:hypothetical protein
MMSFRKAGAFLIAEALALAASVVTALTETPWLMLPFLFARLDDGGDATFAEGGCLVLYSESELERQDGNSG